MAFRRLSAALFSLCFVANLGCGGDDDEPLFDCLPSMLCDIGPARWDGGPTDPGPEDLGVDLPPTTPFPSLGDECTVDGDCKTSQEVCVGPSFREGSGLGGADDPITGHPDGEDTFVPVPFFPGGYCTYSYPEEGVTPAQCDLRGSEDIDPVCGDIGECIDLLGLDTEENTSDFVPGFCARDCRVDDLSDNGRCRAGYECRLVEEVCLPGCQSDDECRIQREETNGIDGLQTPSDCAADDALCTPTDCEDTEPADPEACADPASHFDALVYDTESEATCDPTTFRCVDRPSTESASGGDPCTDDRDCEAGGTCLTETEDGVWAGGSCTKVRCDLEGNGCANDGVCQEAGVGVFGCFEGCTVGGVDPSSEPATWVAEGSARSSCREGYGCYWGGEGGAGEAANGVCLPVDYETTVTASNVGGTCERDADCFSPFGQGFCIRDEDFVQAEGFDQGYCSVRNCAAPWFTSEANVCGEGAACAAFDATDPAFALCFQTCEAAEECSEGLGCVRFTEESRGCWLGCESTEDCRADEVCNEPGTVESRCIAPPSTG